MLTSRQVIPNRLKERSMERAEIPQYTIFQDYRSSQRIAVVARWFILVTWLALINYNNDQGAVPAFNTMGATLIVVNGYVHWRILKGRPITWPYVLALSLMDLTIITAVVMMTSRFENTFFPFYYPALLGVALIFRRRISFVVVTVVAGVYTGMSVVMEPGVDTSVLFDGDEKELAVRVVSMVAIVVVANLMTRLERDRRSEAVEAERARMEENVQLQRRAQEAELQVQLERIRISQEIHDGAAQSAYVLSLGLETCFQMKGESSARLQEKLHALHQQSRQALWELRYPINLGSLFEGKGLARILEDHLSNFRTITSTPVVFSMNGQEKEIHVSVKQRVFSVAHNALTNAYKYAKASNVKVDLVYDHEIMRLSISDDGVGVDTAELSSSSGHGIRNMRRTARELGGHLDMDSTLGEGTTVVLTLPI